MPGRRCCFCDSKQRLHEKADCSFHKFPSEPSIRMRWLQFCDYTTEDDVSKLLLCSKHFSRDQFFVSLNKLRLKPGACPTIKKPKQSGNVRKQVAISYCKDILSDDVVQSVKAELSAKSVMSESPKVIVKSDVPVITKLENVNTTYTQPGTSLIRITNVESLTVPTRETCDSSTQTDDTSVMVQQDDEEWKNALENSTAPLNRRYNEPRYIGDIKNVDIALPGMAKISLQLAIDTAVKQRKKITALQQANRRLVKKINSLKSHIQSLEDNKSRDENVGDVFLVGCNVTIDNS